MTPVRNGGLLLVHAISKSSLAVAAGLGLALSGVAVSHAATYPPVPGYVKCAASVSKKKIKVKVKPKEGGTYTFKLQQKKNGSWKSKKKTYKVKPGKTVTIKVKNGTYRANCSGGTYYKGTTSPSVKVG